jgi:hypothetical protein
LLKKGKSKQKKEQIRIPLYTKGRNQLAKAFKRRSKVNISVKIVLTCNVVSRIFF